MNEPVFTYHASNPERAVARLIALAKDNNLPIQFSGKQSTGLIFGDHYIEGVSPKPNKEGGE